MGACKREGSQKGVLCQTVAVSEALDAFTSFQLAQAEEDGYKTVIQKYEECCTH